MQVKNPFFDETLRPLLHVAGKKHSSTELSSALSRLDYVVLTWKQLSDAQVCALGRALVHNYTVTFLDLSQSHLSDRGVLLLSVALRSNRVVKRLVINDNQCGITDGNVPPSLGEVGQTALFTMLSSTRSLREFQFCNGGLTAPALIALKQVLERYQTLKSLTLVVDSERTTKGVAEAVGVNKGLETLELVTGQTDLGKGWEALAGMLNSNTSLKRLFIHHSVTHKKQNPPHSEQAFRSFCVALSKNRSLTALVLHFLELGPQEAALLGEALRTNQALKALQIDHCKLHDAGGISITEALLENRTLIELDLSACYIGVEGLRALFNALKANRTVKKLTLRLTAHVSEELVASDLLKENSAVRVISLQD